MFYALQERIDIMTEHLQNEAGTNSLQDREYVGYIKAVKDVLLTQLDDVVKETE